MSRERIRQLLDELGEELGKSNVDVDDETRELFNELDRDIRQASDGEAEEDIGDRLMERASELEARFAAQHPNLELFLREIADTLGKLGI